MRRLRHPRGEAGRSKDPNTDSFYQKDKPTKIDATRIQRIDFFGPRSVSRDLDASSLRPAAVDPLRPFVRSSGRAGSAQTFSTWPVVGNGAAQVRPPSSR